MNHIAMTKTELLEQVTGRRNGLGYSIELAKVVQSDESCHKKREQLMTESEKYENRWAWSTWTIALAVFIAVSVFFVFELGVRY